MNKLGYGLIPLAIAATYATAARADEDRRFYVAPMFSYTFADDHRGADDGLGGTLALGKRLTQGLELELLGQYSQFKTKSGDFPASAGPQPQHATLWGAGLGANIYLAPSSEGFLNGLFVHLDVMRGQGRDAPGAIRDYTTTLFHAGLGYKWTLTKDSFGPFAPGIALLVEGLYQHDAHGRGQLGTSYYQGTEHQYFQEGMVNLGLRIPLGGRAAPAAAPAPEPVQVVPVEQPPPAEPAPAPAPPPCEPPAPGQPISLEGCKTGDTLVLRGVNFEFNKATLTVNAKTLLDQVADALLARPDIKVEIDGHTDGKGSVAYNQKLSERRAASVKQYLVGRGIDAGRMTTKGFGKSQPIADNNTEEGRELNRRVELKVTESGGGAAPAASTETPAAPAAEAAPAASTEAPAAPAAEAASTATPGESTPAQAAPTESAPPADSSAAPAPDASAAPATDSSSAPAQ